MSRFGNKKIVFDKTIKLEYVDRLLTAKNSKGELKLNIPDVFDLEISDNSILVKQIKEVKKVGMIHGTIRQLINNMIIGLLKGFEKKLLFQGVGYKAQVSGSKLILHLGYSHPIEYVLPQSVDVKVETNSQITLTSYDKQALGEVAVGIRNLRIPEPYKGRGVRFVGEILHRKEVKKGKKKE